jgi:hypothetical protein
MKRLLLAALVLGGPAAGLAPADYLKIKIDLNKLLNPQAASMQGAPVGGVVPPVGGVVAPGMGRGGRGGRGQPVLPTFPTVPPAGQTDQQEEEPQWVTAYLELKQPPKQIPRLPLFAVDHPWGGAVLSPSWVNSAGSFKVYQLPSVAKRFSDRKKDLDKNGKTPEKLLSLAEWALRHGLPGPFLKTMDELAKESADHPAVKALAEVRKAMQRPVSVDDPAAAGLIQELQAESYRRVQSEPGHYVVLTNIKPGGPGDADVKKWLERLEANYNNFFYWFAVKGKVLPVPAHRLVAVLVDNPKDFEAKHQSLNPAPMADDGFLVRRDNVAVFSARRIDDAYDRLEKHNASEWTQFRVTRDQLLSGAVAKNAQLAQVQGGMLVAKLQTLALIQKALEEEHERTVATHEGTRQLLAAAGLLPRSVAAAEWVHFGMASFFETPYQAYYLGVGMPSWVYLVEFKHLKKSELANNHEVLLKTIGDRYFVAANTTQEQLTAHKDEREELEPELDHELKTARTTAWALAYYLARHRLDGLQQYFQELGNLPRDLEFDEAVLQGCFGRAFGLTDPSDPNKLDLGKVAKLAEDWYKTMDQEHLDIMDAQTEALKDRSKAPPRQQRPNQPHRTPGTPNNPNIRPPAVNPTVPQLPRPRTRPGGG